MAEKKITRKVILKVVSSKEVTPKKEEEEVQPTKDQARVGSKRTCFFCQSKTTPAYTDIVVLRRFITDRAKIVPKDKSNVCSRHQRALAKQIKYARHLALLPFTPKV